MTVHDFSSEEHYVKTFPINQFLRVTFPGLEVTVSKQKLHFLRASLVFLFSGASYTIILQKFCEKEYFICEPAKVG